MSLFTKISLIMNIRNVLTVCLVVICLGFNASSQSTFTQPDPNAESSISVLLPNDRAPLTNVLKLKLSGMGYTDETIVRFIIGATTGFDWNFDAYKLPGGLLAPSIYSLIDTCTRLAINAHPELYQSYHVPLEVKAGVAGNYMIEVEIMGEFDQGVDIIMEDTLTGINTNLLQDSTYSFMADTGKGGCGTRFILHFQTMFTSNEDPVIKNSLNVYPNPSRGLFQIDNLIDQAEIEVYNMAGQMVYGSSTTESATTIDLTGFSNGTYLLVIKNESITEIQRILIENYTH